MPNEYFSNEKTFAAHLVKMGWVAKGDEESVMCACTAFAMIQRRAGIDAAQKAMIKACEKAR